MESASASLRRWKMQLPECTSLWWKYPLIGVVTKQIVYSQILCRHTSLWGFLQSINARVPGKSSQKSSGGGETGFVHSRRVFRRPFWCTAGRMHRARRIRRKKEMWRKRYPDLAGAAEYCRSRKFRHIRAGNSRKRKNDCWSRKRWGCYKIRRQSKSLTCGGILSWWYGKYRHAFTLFKRNSTGLGNTSPSAGSFNPKDLNICEGLLMVILFAQ